MTTIIRHLSDCYGDLRGYGRGRIRAEVARNTSLPAEVLREISGELFQKRVREALQRFPFYKDTVRHHCGGLPSLESRIEPSDLPIWTRQDQRTFFSSLQGPPIPGAFVHATGGSTGEPTRFYVTRESYEWRNAVSDRGYSWAGAEEGRKSYYVWGAPIKPLSPLKKLKVDIHHAFQRRKYFNSFIFNDVRKMACCREINRFCPPVLVGYAGNLVDLALYVKRERGMRREDAAGTAATTEESAKHTVVTGVSPVCDQYPTSLGPLTWKARSLVIGAEGLQSGQREFLQETLADEVFMSYGSREFMLIGMECKEHGGYHVSVDNLYVEVVDEVGQPVPPGQMGRIVVTDLRNDANPFIRYEIGDLGAWATEPCACGLPFPLLARVEGRIQEYLVTADGSRLTALFIPHLIKEFVWVRGYQIEQENPGVVRVNVLSDQEPAASDAVNLAAALQAKLGEGSHVDVMRVSALKKSASGKCPIVVSSLGRV